MWSVLQFFCYGKNTKFHDKKSLDSQKKTLQKTLDYENKLGVAPLHA